jgi:hypothetical protein
MDWTLEVVILPVSDIDRSIEFYRDKVGFDLDHDTKTDQMHVVQLTPRGSGCSIVFGDLPPQREIGAGLDAGYSWSSRTPKLRDRSCSIVASRPARSWPSRPTTAGRSSGSVIPTAIPGPCRSSKSAAIGR